METCLAGGAKLGWIDGIMRYLMYNRCYARNDMASGMHTTLSPIIKEKIVSTDFSKAEKKCLQHIEINKLMNDAANVLVSP